MKNKNIWILTLVGLVLGSTFNNSYGQNEVIIIEKQREIRIDPIKIYGAAELGAAHNIMLQYPSKTSFTPSLITMGSTGDDLVNMITFDTSVKLGFETNFHVGDKTTKGVLEFGADTEAVKLGKLFFQSGGWTAGLRGNNFGNVATFAPVKVILLGWEKEINSNFTLGVSVEQGKKYELHATEKKASIEKSKLKPRGDVPAASARLEYKLADKFGCIEVSGLARPLGIYNQRTDKTNFQMGYGVNVGTKLNLVRKSDTLTVNVVFGEAIGNYVRDLKELAEIEENTAYIKKTSTGLELEEIKPLMTLGGHASYEHRWGPALRAIIGSGMTSILNEKENKNVRPKGYAMGFYATGKVMYHPTKRTGFGVEYSWGLRINLNEDKQQANHLKALAEFKF